LAAVPETVLRIGLTGGIGSGKSTIGALFIMRRVPVIDTDDIAHQLTKPGQQAHDEILRIFGKSVQDPAGQLNRNALRDLVFDKPIDRKKLESVLHPRIKSVVREKLKDLEVPYVVVIVPLLFESGFVDLVDRVLVVDATVNTQIQRTAARSGLTEPEIRKIIQAQIDRAERLKHADDVIENNGDRQQLEAEVERMHHWYLSLAATRQNSS